MEKDLVIKHNKLIEANYKLSLQEQKLVLILASCVNKKDSNFRSSSFTVKELSKKLGIEENGYYSELKDITKSLMSRVIQIKEPDGLLQVSWLSSAKYFNNSATVELEFSDKLKPYLLQLNAHFTKLELKQIVNLTSVYAIRIYELCKQYEKLKERTIELKELKEILGISKEKGYNLYGNVKLKVLSVAEKEINEKTDILIKFKEIKTGRKVTAVTFLIQKNNLHVVDAEFPEENINIKKLFEFCREQNDNTRKIISESVDKYTFEQLEKNIKYANKNAKTNYSAYLKKAIQENWHTSVTPKSKPKNQEQLTLPEHDIDFNNLTEAEKKGLEIINKKVLKK